MTECDYVRAVYIDVLYGRYEEGPNNLTRVLVHSWI